MICEREKTMKMEKAATPTTQRKGGVSPAPTKDPAPTKGGASPAKAAPKTDTKASVKKGK